jgi:hypothetical protein
MSFEKPITIAKAVREIQGNNFVLPAIQREFVWNATQIERLFDSLMRGYPIGSFLFWEVEPANLGEFQFYRFMDSYHERDHKHNEPINLAGNHRSVTAVLDGQQRLTALNIGLRGWYAEKLPYYRWDSDNAFPKRRLCVNLMGPPDEDVEMAYGFKMVRSDTADLEVVTNEGEYWFPLETVLSFEKVADAFNYCVRNGLTEGRNTFPSDTMVELWHLIHERPIVNFFLEEEQDLDKVLNIFIRVNSGGTQLSYSDMLLSIATAQWREKDARQEIYSLVDDLNDVGEGFDFNKDFVLKSSLVLTDAASIEFRVNSFNRKNMLAVEDQWEKIERALRLAVKLVASWGFSRQTLPSNYAVIPLAYYLYRRDSPTTFVESGKFAEDRKKMVRWLRIALLKRTFGGSPDNVLRRIRGAMQDELTSFPAGGIYAALRGTAKSMDFDLAGLEGLLGYRYHQKYTFSVLSMLYPWLKYDQQFHMDHIFPRSMFSDKNLLLQGIPEEQWEFYKESSDNLANLQLLQGLPNQEKSDQDFEEWLQGQNDTLDDLEVYRRLHLIPDVDLSFENFDGFVKAREHLILERLADLLGVFLKPGVEESLEVGTDGD